MSTSVSPRAPELSTTRPGLRGALVVCATLAVAAALTLALRAHITHTVFVFFFGAVAISAFYTGLIGGLVAAFIGVLIVVRYVLLPLHAEQSLDSADIVGLVGFLAVSTVLASFADALRLTRARSQTALQQLRTQTAELEVHREEAQVMAVDLEQTNVQLELANAQANQARDRAESREARLRLLDDASRVLSSSLDYEQTITRLAQLAVPKFADWCAVDLRVDGAIRQLALAHVDPAKTEWARQVDARYPIDINDTTGVPQVIRSGEAQFVPHVTDEMLATAARDAEHLELLRKVGVASVIIVPIAARGETLGALTLIRSSHDRAYDEQDLSLASNLARRSGIAIDNARLYRAALVANEAKANFLATMSHELRTPLTAILGYEELLFDGITGPVSDQQRQQLQRIKVSAMHLLTLIDEILQYARVEAGRESVLLEAVVAKGVVDDAVTFVAPLTGDRDLVLRASPIDASLVLRTDAGKLRQMLVNLLANAVKFTPSGSVIVGAYRRNRKVIFEVSDTGIGIAREHLSHIFDPFWQVEQHATRRAGGSGLGLAVTQRLAQLLGGDVSVESVLRKGTTFRIELPLSVDGAPVTQSRTT